MEKRRTLVVSIPDGNHVYIPRVGWRIHITNDDQLHVIERRTKRELDKSFEIRELALYAAGQWHHVIWKS